MFLSPIIQLSLQVLIVSWFVIRTIRKYSSISFFEKSRMTKIGTLILFISFCFSWLVSTSSPLFFTPTLIVLLLSPLLHFALGKQLETRYRKAFQDFLHGVILHMKCGQSLHSSTKMNLNLLPKILHSDITQILEKRILKNSTFPFESLKFHRNHFLEFQKIANQNGKQLDQLCLLQKQMHLDALLRHRSSQALLQTKIQSFFLCLLYCGVSLYGVQTYSWTHFKPFLLISLTLLALGLLLLQFLTRKKKWKT